MISYARNAFQISISILYIFELTFDAAVYCVLGISLGQIKKIVRFRFPTYPSSDPPTLIFFSFLKKKLFPISYLPHFDAMVQFYMNFGAVYELIM